MNKLKAKLQKARSLISIKTYKRPMIFVISMMLLLNILILCVAAIIATLIDDSFDGFIDAFANGSLKWMLSPNAILAIENPKTLFLAVVVLITGLILFSGTIIALTTNQIKEYFHKKQSGSGKIFLESHIAILNWNNKVPELVADLLHVENRKVTVMILADIDKAYAEKQIVNAIQKLKKADRELSNFNVLVKHGDPLIHTDLQDISIEEASSILIMNKEGHETIAKELSKSDLNVIKVILSLGRIEFRHNPPIVAEIKNIETKAKIQTMSKVVHTLHEHTILPICFDRRLGQIIAQTIINPQMEDVYLSLFSFEGSEVYPLPGGNFEECLQKCSHAFPVAMDKGTLFVLSLSDTEVNLRTEIPYEIKALKVVPIVEACNMEVYIIGKNNKLDFILSSFREYERIHQSLFHANWVEEDKLSEFVEKINCSEKPCTLVLLSDEHQMADSQDANVIDTLIYLEGHLKKKELNVIVELLDPKNDHIIRDFNIRNTIISNKIISLLLSKLALYKETAVFYDNLLTIAPNVSGEDDQAIVICEASAVLKEEFPIAFASQKSLIASFYEAFAKKVIPLGYFRNETLKLFSGNLHETTNEMVEATDLYVFMKL